MRGRIFEHIDMCCVHVLCVCVHIIFPLYVRGMHRMRVRLTDAPDACELVCVFMQVCVFIHACIYILYLVDNVTLLLLFMIMTKRLLRHSFIHVNS